MSSLLEGRTKPLPVLAKARGNAGGYFRGCQESSGDLLSSTTPFLVFIKTARRVNTGRQPIPTKPLGRGVGGWQPGRKMNHCDRDTFMAFSAQLCGIQHWWKPWRSPLMSIHVPDGPRLTDVNETKSCVYYLWLD